jgi:hypothetical protein
MICSCQSVYRCRARQPSEAVQAKPVSSHPSAADRPSVGQPATEATNCTSPAGAAATGLFSLSRQASHQPAGARTAASHAHPLRRWVASLCVGDVRLESSNTPPEYVCAAARARRPAVQAELPVVDGICAGQPRKPLPQGCRSHSPPPQPQPQLHPPFCHVLPCTQLGYFQHSCTSNHYTDTP